MALRIRRRMRILVYGDSRTNSGFASDEVKWFVGLRDYFRNLWGPDAPVWIASGVVAEDVAAGIARLGTGCYPHAPDIIINSHGVNDVINAVANATFQTNVTTMITNQLTATNYSNRKAPTQIAWTEVPCCGEKWPNGANAFDTVATGIDAKNLILQSVCRSAGAEFIRLRAGILAYETANNLSNAGSGLLMMSADGATGKHEIALGATVEAGLIVPQLQIDP